MKLSIETDKELFEKYQLLLGDDTPATLDKFKQRKHNDKEGWRLLKVDYRRRNKLQNHPEKALPNFKALAIADNKGTD